MGDVVLTYSLAKSVVRISGQVTATHDTITGKRTQTAEAAAELLTVADLAPSAQQELRIPERAHANTSNTVVFRDDRRLESVEASFTGRGPNTLKAVAAIGGLLIGGAVAFVNPIAGGGVVAGSLSALGSSTRKLFRALPVTVNIDEQDEPPAMTAYREAHRAEAELLATYNRALARLTTEHAAASDGPLDELERLSRALQLVRGEAERYQRAFAEWCLEQIETTASPIEIHDFDIDDLPTRADLLARVNTRDVDDFDARHLQGTQPRWVQTARRFGVAVSIDNMSPQRPEQPSYGHGEIKVNFRPGTDITMRLWKVRHIESDNSGRTTVVDIATPTSYYEADLMETRIGRVVKQREAAVCFALDIDAWKSGKLKLTFNDLGEPKEIGGDASSQGADAIAAIGDTLKTGAESGSALAAAMTPGSATATYLERKVALAKNRAELTPADDDAKALAGLKHSVEIAELEARLRLARLNALRTSGTIIYNVGGT
jgi:hypothetical protein